MILITKCVHAYTHICIYTGTCMHVHTHICYLQKRSDLYKVLIIYYIMYIIHINNWFLMALVEHCLLCDPIYPTSHFASSSVVNTRFSSALMPPMAFVYGDADHS